MSLQVDEIYQHLLSFHCFLTTLKDQQKYLRGTLIIFSGFLFIVYKVL